MIFIEHGEKSGVKSIYNYVGVALGEGKINHFLYLSQYGFTFQNK